MLLAFSNRLVDKTYKLSVVSLVKVYLKYLL